MGDQQTRVVDDQPHRQGRGRSIPQPGSDEDVQGHSLRPSDEPADPSTSRLFQELPDSDEDDVEGHVFMGKNRIK
ncbi:MAG TPA: hypothetical protein VFK54_05235 [Candidatus Limnocylindrales bacterium]|nr:hypothetical protein [Candidatus Limnocylindrales bacterium]